MHLSVLILINFNWSMHSTEWMRVNRLLRYLAKELQKFAGGTFNITYGRIKADVFGVCMPYQNEGQIGEFSAYMRARLRQYDLEFDLMPSIGIYRIRDREISIAGDVRPGKSGGKALQGQLYYQLCILLQRDERKYHAGTAHHKQNAQCA